MRTAVPPVAGIDLTALLIRVIAMMCSIAMVGLLVAPAAAAEISVHTARNDADGSAINVISIAGRIVAGDHDQFNHAIAFLSGNNNLVFLNSPGGSVVEGLEIGKTIRLRNYDTAVDNDAFCASVCGLIWLAGRNRLAGRTATIGFHAAFTGTGDDAQVSGAANALIGSYLNKLGLSDTAIYFITSASPQNLNLLDPVAGRETGIQYSLLPNPIPSPEPSPRPAPPPVVSQDVPSGTPLERRMIGMVLNYFALWSRPGTDVEAIAVYYADSVDFYATAISRSKVMEVKRQFASRWPVRRWTVKTINADCASTCTVTGIVAWDASSEERNDHSVGSAGFKLIIAPNAAGSPVDGAILSENGSLLSRHIEPLHPPAQGSIVAQPPMAGATGGMSGGLQTTTAGDAFAAGRQDRIAYENWYAGLPDTAYKDGATFWANNRSNKPQPSCSQAGTSPDWQQGCNDARARTMISDFRRRTDRNYWSGWNSL